LGQRLVLNIRNNEEIIANGYYHWSGYSTSSAETALKAFMRIGNQIKDPVIKAIRMLEATGAGSTDSVKEILKEMYPNNRFKTVIDRNTGLIEVTKKGIEESLFWSEGNIYIDIDKKTIIFEVLWELDKEDIDNVMEDITTLPTMENYSMEDAMSLNEFVEFFDKIKNLYDNGKYYFKNSEGIVFGLIA